MGTASPAQTAGRGEGTCPLKRVPSSALLQASPLKGLSASVPPQRWLRGGRVPGPRPPACSAAAASPPWPGARRKAPGLFCRRQPLGGQPPPESPAPAAIPPGFCSLPPGLTQPLRCAVPGSGRLTRPPRGQLGSSFCSCPTRVTRQSQGSCVSPRPSRALARLLHRQPPPPPRPPSGWASAPEGGGGGPRQREAASHSLLRPQSQSHRRLFNLTATFCQSRHPAVSCAGHLQPSFWRGR